MDITELLSFAQKNKSSDLHLVAGKEPMVRIDGSLRVLERFPASMALPVIARLKAMAEVPIGGAALVESVTGNLGDQFSGSVGQPFRHQFKKIARLGRSVGRRAHFAGDMVFNRAHKHGFASRTVH